jgi:hypothetical protein
MTVTINIPPEREAAYQALAQAKGLSVEQWLRQLVDQAAPLQLETSPSNQDSRDTWEEEFDAWVNSFPHTPPLSDEAISRASMYPDRW